MIRQFKGYGASLIVDLETEMFRKLLCSDNTFQYVDFLPKILIFRTHHEKKIIIEMIVLPNTAILPD